MRKPISRSEVPAIGTIRRRSRQVPPSRAGGSAAPRPKDILAAAGVRPSKARGQNFLVQGAVADRIVAMAELGRDDDVVEIGPGLGILSDRILSHPIRRLHLIELDSRLAAHLRTRLTDVPNVEIVEADVLKLDLAPIIERPPVKIIGNLPFNVAAAVLRKLSDYRHFISRMVLMFQREVADRIRAKPGDQSYGALSVYTALDWAIDRHFRVDAGSFHPRPKVDAEVLLFVPRSQPWCEAHELEQVLAVIRAGFSSPRKIIRNTISAGLKLGAAEVEAELDAAAIDPHARAETLSVADFVRLARAIALRHPASGQEIKSDA